MFHSNHALLVFLPVFSQINCNQSQFLLFTFLIKKHFCNTRDLFDTNWERSFQLSLFYACGQQVLHDIAGPINRTSPTPTTISKIMVKVQINPVITLVTVIVYFTMPDLITHVKCECINAWFTNSIHFASSRVVLIKHFQIYIFFFIILHSLLATYSQSPNTFKQNMSVSIFTQQRYQWVKPEYPV